MSIFRSVGVKFIQIARNSLATTASSRQLSVGAARFCVEKEKTEEPAEEEEKKVVRLDIDRTKIIPVETSIRYLQSEAYKTTYGTQPVWVQFRRNFKGQIPPRKTRKTCIRAGVISTGSPCPICRDEYLVLDYRNLDLLKQFISPHNGQILSYSKTNLCQKKHLQLLVAIEKARNYGLLTFDVPFREFDYDEYYGKGWDKVSQ